MANTVYGIDLGTTYSCIARVGTDGQPEVLTGLDGAATMPSVILFTSHDDYVVGEAARRLARAQPDSVCSLVKRRMGEADWRFAAHRQLWTAPAVSSLILKALVTDAAFTAGEMPKDVVVTVPAYFGDEERRATMLAGEYAGLNVLDIINEPTAAALAHGLGRLGAAGALAKEIEEETVLVYDLGGGTFDVTIIELAARRLSVLAIDGDHELGGADWDERLALHLAAAFLAQHPDAEDPLDDSAGAQTLLLAAEAAKRALTDAEKTEVLVTHDGREARVTVTRDELDVLSGTLLERTLELTRSAISAARQRGGDRLDRVLLVGGSSRMPAVARRLQEELGIVPQLADPDLSVAKGAALYGEKKQLERMVAQDLVTRGQLLDGDPLDRAAAPDFAAACARVGEAYGLPPGHVERTVLIQVNTVCSRGFGVVTAMMGGDLGVTYLVHRNDRLPVHVRELFGTVTDDQDMVRIRVVEQAGGAESPRLGDAKVLIEGQIADIPPGSPMGTMVTVSFRMGFDGLLEVEATHEAVDRPLTLRVETGATLTQAEVARERAEVARLRRRDR